MTNLHPGITLGESMPESLRIIDILNGGGPMLFIPVLWAFVFLITSTLVLLGKSKLHRATLFIFPLGFTILAVSYYAAQWFFTFSSIIDEGPPDPAAYASNGIHIARSTLLICAGAGLSFVVATLGLLIPGKKSTREKP